MCIINMEAFAVFLSQNKNNEEAVKKLFEDVIALNQILAKANVKQNNNEKSIDRSQSSMNEDKSFYKSKDITVNEV